MPIFTAYYRSRILIGGAALLCFAAFWWSGYFFHIPLERGFQASLMEQPSAAASLAVVAVTFACCVALGTAVAGVIRFDAGLLAAAVGLSALSFRGGSMRDAMQWALAHGWGAKLFPRLAVETAILGILLGVCWLLVQMARRHGLVKDRTSIAVDATDKGIGEQLASIGFQAVATALGVMLLATVEAKQQVMAAVFISAWAGSVIAQYLLPSSSSGWNWAAPLLVGIVGYLLAWNDPAGLDTASLSGTFAALARPLPLDYASAGPAGAILGHWMARQWQAHGEEAAPTA